jgi:hypothetical protein
LCGIADEPFCPSANGSWTSRTSVRAKWRISVAILSRVDAAIAIAVMSSACRSRWITWVEASTLRRPRRAHTSSSTLGSTEAYVPTAPLIAPTETTSRARRSRSRSRSSSNAHTASLCPKLVGSAITPCERPAMTVSRWCSAIRLVVARRCSNSARSTSAAARSWRANPVSITSEDVSPKWIHRPAGPIASATTSTKAATSWRVTASRAITAATVNAPRSRQAPASPGGTVPSSARASTASSSISSQFARRASSDHTASISGSRYRSITA